MSDEAMKAEHEKRAEWLTAHGAPQNWCIITIEEALTIKSELAEKTKDSARLDWLEERRGNVALTLESDGIHIRSTKTFRSFAEKAANVRAAIDAARGAA